MALLKWLASPALLLGLALPAAHAGSIDESALLPVEQAFQLDAKAVTRGWIEFQFKVTPGYYLYRDRIKIAPTDALFKSNPLAFPPGEMKEDPNFGRMEVFHNDFTAKLTGAAADGATAVTFKVSYQGCADLGICYPPQHVQLTVALPAADATAALKSNPQPSAGLVIGAPAPTLNLLSGDVGQAPITFDPVANAALPLPPEVAFVFEAIADQPTELLLRFSMPKGYYLYRDHSSFALADADVGELGVPRWPTPQLFDDPEFGKVPVYFDVVEIPLSLARRHGAPGQIQLIGKFQGCESGGVCYPPMTRSLRVELPAATTEALAIAAARVQSELAQVTAQVTTPAPALAAANPAPAGVAASGLFKALLFALLGGLVLNLMPCVLPVLSLKAVSLAEAGETPETAHRHALWYTAGVMSTFALIGLLVLGLRAGGQALGWGFQLQQPLIVATMGYVMVVLGLGLSGVITLGSSLTNVGSGLATHSGARGDFFTGVLACVVASPCTAPFMGGALAFAFMQPALIAVLVFLALGFGLALPFLLIGFVPGLAHRLPKPGKWMETLKQVLAFPLYFTAVWLAWVLGHQRGADAMALWLVGAISLIAALWWWERGRYRANQSARVLGTGLLLLLTASSLWGVHRLPTVNPAASASNTVSTVYSESTLAALRAAHRTVFVNMTADWCLSCKVNERSTLGTERFRKLLQDTGTAYLKGDWTNEDPGVAAFLKQHGAVGVPLYVVYPGTGGAAFTLPTLLTPEILERALR